MPWPNIVCLIRIKKPLFWKYNLKPVKEKVYKSLLNQTVLIFSNKIRVYSSNSSSFSLWSWMPDFRRSQILTSRQNGTSSMNQSDYSKLKKNRLIVSLSLETSRWDAQIAENQAIESSLCSYEFARLSGYSTGVYQRIECFYSS